MKINETSTVSTAWKYTSYVTLALLIGVVLHAYVFGKPGMNGPGVGQTEYPLIDPARSLIPQEDFIVNIQPLRDEVNALVEEFGRENVSIYIEALNTGANISINPNLYIWPASLPKMPLGIAVMKKNEDGDWNLTNELVLMQGDKDSRSGDETDSLWEYPIGTRFTIEHLVEELLVHSDNTAWQILMRNMHEDDLRAAVEAVGLHTLLNPDGKLSAKEYSRYWRSLYTSSYLSRESSERILELLGTSPFDRFIANGLPLDVHFSNKYGLNTELRSYADSGIVYVPNRPYIITVMVQGDTNVSFADEQKKVEVFMQELGRASYEFFTTSASNP